MKVLFSEIKPLGREADDLSSCDINNELIYTTMLHLRHHSLHMGNIIDFVALFLYNTVFMFHQ
jgi:hypothetical protein